MHYEYEGTVLRWVDGDTVALEVTKEFDFGFHVTVTGKYEDHFRLLYVDTPERGHHQFHDATLAAELLAPIGSKVWVTTHKADQYGRYLADIINEEGQNVSQELILQGWPVYGARTRNGES